MLELKKTPVFDEYLKYGAKLVEFGGYNMPVQFEKSITEEHNAVRNFAGLFDVSHMGEFIIKGTDSLKFINYLLTNDFSKISENKIFYSLMCYQDGGVVDDLTVYCFNENYFWLVVNASNLQKDFNWIISNATGFDVEIIDISENTGLLALQGPFAQKILQKFTSENLDLISNFTFKDNVELFGIKCLVSRSGYTGEDGFEIYCDSQNVAALFNNILENGSIEENSVLPIGLGARDTLRFEASMPLYGNELSKDYIATESGLNFAIKLDADNFIGKESLLKSKINPKRKLIGLELLDKGVPRHGYEVLKNDKVIGFITTGYISPSVNKAIAMAYIDIGFAKIGEEVDVRIRNKNLKAKIISKKFKYKKN